MESYIVSNWREKFDRLIAGLDYESVETVTRCLTALYTLEINDAAGIPHPPISCFLTDDEIETFVNNENYLYENTFQHPDGTWEFNGYKLPILSFEYCTFIDEYSLPSLDLSKISSDSAIIDVGAYIGDSAVVFNRYLPNNKIYSFEPVQDLYDLLLQTISLNDMENIVTPVMSALGDVPNAIVRGVSSGSCSRISIDGDSDFHMTSLDNWVITNKIPHVGIIKVDIEGSEQKFLAGARMTITRDRPLMFLSIYHNPSDYFDIKPLIESWDLNYKFKIFKPMHNNIITETLLICIPND